MTERQTPEKEYEDVFNEIVSGEPGEGGANDEEQEEEHETEPQENEGGAEEDEEENEREEVENSSEDEGNFPEEGESNEPTEDVAELKRIIAALKQQNAELAHSVKSNAGRVSALHKKNNALEKRIEELTQNKSETSLEDSEDAVQTLLEEYPNLAKGMIALAKRELQAELEPFKNQVQERLETVDEVSQQAAIEKQIQVLDSRVPNWREIAQDDFFQNWLAVQPEEIQLMATSVDPEKVIAVFGLYSQYIDSLGFNQGQQSQQETQEPETTQPPAKKRRKVADVSPHAGGVVSSSASSDVLDDYDSIWNSIVARKTRNR